MPNLMNKTIPFQAKYALTELNKKGSVLMPDYQDNSPFIPNDIASVLTHSRS